MIQWPIMERGGGGVLGGIIFKADLNLFSQHAHKDFQAVSKPHLEYHKYCIAFHHGRRYGMRLCRLLIACTVETQITCMCLYAMEENLVVV